MATSSVPFWLRRSFGSGTSEPAEGRGQTYPSADCWDGTAAVNVPEFALVWRVSPASLAPLDCLPAAGTTCSPATSLAVIAVPLQQTNVSDRVRDATVSRTNLITIMSPNFVGLCRPNQ